jgi:hypothetical protein
MIAVAALRQGFVNPLTRRSARRHPSAEQADATPVAA